MHAQEIVYIKLAVVPLVFSTWGDTKNTATAISPALVQYFKMKEDAPLINNFLTVTFLGDESQMTLP